MSRSNLSRTSLTERHATAPGVILAMAMKYRAYWAAMDAIQAIYNQPRMPEDARGDLDGEMERLTDRADHAAMRIEMCIPSNDDEATERAEILLLHALRCGHHAADIAKLAAGLAEANRGDGAVS